MDQIFAASRKISDGIGGMLSPFSMAAMDSILTHQAELGVRGDMVEFGALRGKSAAILCGRLTNDETLHLYDVLDQFDRDALAQTGARLTFNIRNTFELTTGHFRDRRRAIRFCHVDASHMFEPTMHEMALADYMLSDDGILCLDDYANLNFSQILAATFKYLFTKRTDLTMFMVTNEKAYLCRRPMFPVYVKVLNSIIERMAARGIGDACVARTDDTASYGAFYLRYKQEGETDDLYGVEIYRSFYEIRDHFSPKARARRVARKLLGAWRHL